MRALALLLFSVFSLLVGCERKISNELRLQPVMYSQLHGWEQDSMADLVLAMQRSCNKIASYKPDSPVLTLQHGKVVTWQHYQLTCKQLSKQALKTPKQIRSFFEKWFVPHQVHQGHQRQSMLTGYFIPMIEGAKKPSKNYKYPIYARPKDLVTVEDLSIFRSEQQFKNRRIAGKVKNGRLIPYLTRTDIYRGQLSGQGLELFWTNDLVGLFFMQIQGSGVIKTPDGKRIILGYDGTNGHKYTAIGRVLIQRGEIPKKQISMQSIKAWLKKQNPKEVLNLLHTNQSYVFFRQLNIPGVLGSQATQLVPMRSLAVDSAYLPLGIPIWLDMEHPKTDKRIQRLVIAQDTGGAIRGPLRGDLFCGFGHSAGELAGILKSKGTHYVLIPKYV